jgi:hypothetical protein
MRTKTHPSEDRIIEGVTDLIYRSIYCAPA